MCACSCAYARISVAHASGAANACSNSHASGAKNTSDAHVSGTENAGDARVSGAMNTSDACMSWTVHMRTHTPTSHLCGPVDNRPWPDSGQWPKGWGPLT